MVSTVHHGHHVGTPWGHAFMAPREGRKGAVRCWSPYIAGALMTWGMSMGAHKSGKFWPCWALHGHSVGTFASLLGMPSPTPQPPGRRRLVEHLEDHKARHDLTWQEVAD